MLSILSLLSVYLCTYIIPPEKYIQQQQQQQQQKCYFFCFSSIVLPVEGLVPSPTIRGELPPGGVRDESWRANTMSSIRILCRFASNNNS